MPPDMPAATLRPVCTEHDGDPAGHVLAAVVAEPLDDRRRAGVADAEPLPDLAADEELTRRRAVRDDVAGDDVVLGDERACAVGPDHDPAAGEALAEVVVGVALQPQGDAGRQERAEALPRRTRERDVDRAVGQALHRWSPWSPRGRGSCRPSG